MHFATTSDALLYLRNVHPEMTILAMETTERSKLYSQVDYRPYYYRSAENTSTTTTTTSSSVIVDKSSSDHLTKTSIGGGGGGGIALILGNEVTGVDSRILQMGTNVPWDSTTAATTKELESKQSLIDAIIQLPTFGQKNSLNVAACAPVVIYEVLRQWSLQNDST
jgi:tRNA(Leu) C34 or U34 (ribose-2'-O)-methylase TrmL